MWVGTCTYLKNRPAGNRPKTERKGMDCNGGGKMMKWPVLRQSLNCETTCVLATDPGKKLWMAVNPAAGTINFVAIVDDCKYGPTLSLESAVMFYNGGMNDDRS